MNNKIINNNLIYIKKLESLLKNTIIALARVEARCDKLELKISKLNKINDIVSDDDNNNNYTNHIDKYLPKKRVSNKGF